MNADLAIAVTAAAALLAVNAAYEIRQRRRQQQAREHARLQALCDALTRQVWAAEFERVRLKVEGEFAALGSDTVWERLLSDHPELQPTTGQKGGTP